MKNKKNITFYILILFFILISFPKAYIDQYMQIRRIINTLIVIIGTFIVLIYISQVKKNRFSKIVLLYILFATLTGISTYINHRDFMYFFKVYPINISTLMCCELILRSNYKHKAIEFIAKYLDILITINFVTVILKKILNIKLYKAASTYFLGMDNRLILFIIPCILCYNYLGSIKQEKNFDKKIKKVYMVGLLSLILTWSASSFVIMIISGIIYVLFSNKKKNFLRQINSQKILVAFFITNYLIVICKIQNFFSSFIVNTLHKSMTLSYRTILWDSAIRMIKSSHMYQLLGLGYFNTSKIIPIYATGAGVNHLHNILVDVTFSTGIVGLIIYIIILHSVASSINRFKNKNTKSVTVLIFGSILICLIFESFELYPIYYFTLFLLYGSKYLNE